jgi:hypothetical protein
MTDDQVLSDMPNDAFGPESYKDGISRGVPITATADNF